MRTVIQKIILLVFPSVVIDANGVIRYRHVGDVNPNNWGATLKPMYEALLAEAKQ